MIFLGTGSCIPNKTRNKILVHSWILVKVLSVVGQIIRFYSTEKTNEVLKKFKNDIYIGISHLHADHHIGLIGILLARQEIQNVQPFLLLAPKQIIPWLHFYNGMESISKGYFFVPNDNLVIKPTNIPELHKIGINSLSNCPVQLVHIQQFLLLEATMEDELIDEAKFKLHSTISQALEQGNKMDAKYILLTHFSQRYAKLPKTKIKEPLNINVMYVHM